VVEQRDLVLGLDLARGSCSRPCSRSASTTWSASRSGTPVCCGIAPRMLVTPARQLESGSQGAYIWWCLAAEPKSHSTGSPSRGSSAQRALLSRAHSPMCVLVT
jgi:hypothetical protein